MSSREDILQNIRRNTRVRYEKPDLSDLEHEALTYEDKVAQFSEVIKVVGGQAVVLQKGEDVNELIKKNLSGGPAYRFSSKRSTDGKRCTSYYMWHVPS